MQKHISLFIIFMLTTVFICCSQAAEEGVAFTIPVDKTLFSEDAIIRVVIWNEKELGVAQNNADCMVSFDMATQEEKTVCPGGKVYQKPEPVEFSFPVQEITEEIKIAATYVQVGEQYRLQVSGKYKDNCNTASASVENTAEEKAVKIAPLSFAVTEMGCVQ